MPAAATRRLLAVTLLLGAVLGLAAAGRVHSGLSLSPPDLAFFFQSCWSAAAGRGFAQTALEFDRGSLLGSIHLSPVRLAHLPLCAVLPDARALAALQALQLALAAGLAGACVARLAPQHRALAAGMALVVGLHPLSLALATVDLRPLVSMVPGGALVVFGLVQARARPRAAGPAAVVFAGGLLCVAAREEAPFVLAAALPFARGAGWRAGLALISAGAVGAALPWWAWGRAGNIQSNADPLGTAADILAGRRPLFRWHQETRFLARALAAGLPALAAPELLLPALAGWLWILVFSSLEPAAPGQGGLHYLAVAGALFLPAVAVGAGRLLARLPPRRARALVIGSGVAVGIFGAPELIEAAGWARPRPAPLAALAAPLHEHCGPVLVPPALAPALAARPVIRIQGHFAAPAARIREEAAALCHAVLPAAAPPDPTAAAEWARWQAALGDAGFVAEATAAGHTRWARLSSPGPTCGCRPAPAPGAPAPGP